MFFNRNKNEQSPSFSFEEINEISKKALPETGFFKSSDGVDIAYYPYVPEKKIDAAVIFIHGGGAYSGAGYQLLAENLCTKHDVSTYLMDIRGHGNSGGPRGDSPKIGQVWEDLRLFIRFIKNKNSGLPLYLAGHSSGGALVLNYLTRHKDDSLAGYIFISPEFGYKSKTARKDRVRFADVKMAVFIKNIATGGKYGNEKAVLLNYPEETLKSQPKIVSYYTYNMAIELTPDKPFEQFKNIDKPFGLFVGDMDELFVPEKLISYAELPSGTIREKSIAKIVKDRKHLSILFDANELIFETMKKISGL